ncbi:MAG: hypothetical protein CVV25_13125 [Ignavibacteriae bacterium HGW-Ignavibacteriae-4]|jgi:transcriptional regulator with XRE-family HTH domain|nr:MAG: hypothetical protein CVV25_13125 [Ignavibacteriae bacterium HGW-Ignavibacteriae-4]
MEKLEEAKRLYNMFMSTGLRKFNFAKILGISQSSLNDYISGRSDIKMITRILSEKGYSIDWLYTGLGNMYFQPEEFENTFEIASSFDVDAQKSRIIEWIKYNYNSIENFKIERDIIDKDLTDSLYNDEVIDHELLIKLENAGCNLKWTIDGNGSQYTENRVGRKLLKQVKK